MTRTAKLLLVVAGYGIALLAATAVTRAHVRATSGPEWTGYSGMLAFGDSALFLGVFCVAAIPATCAALLFLRPVARFWRVTAPAALIVSTTAVLALLLYLLPALDGGGATFGPWVSLAPLRLLLAPLFAGASLLAFLFTPDQGPRRAFLVAAILEAAAFTAAVLVLLLKR